MQNDTKSITDRKEEAVDESTAKPKEMIRFVLGEEGVVIGHYGAFELLKMLNGETVMVMGRGWAE